MWHITVLINVINETDVGELGEYYCCHTFIGGVASPETSHKSGLSDD